MRILIYAFMAFLLFSCQDKSEDTGLHHNSPEVAELNRLVEQTNTQFGMRATDVSAAFSAPGNIEAYVGTTDKDETPFLKLIFNKPTTNGVTRAAIFTLELDEEIVFPDQIQNARVTYLKNQLLVEDLESGLSRAFFVDTGMETDLKLKMAAVDCISLAVEKGPSING